MSFELEGADWLFADELRTLCVLGASKLAGLTAGVRLVSANHVEIHAQGRTAAGQPTPQRPSRRPLNRGNPEAAVSRCISRFGSRGAHRGFPCLLRNASRRY